MGSTFGLTKIFISQYDNWDYIPVKQPDIYFMSDPLLFVLYFNI